MPRDQRLISRSDLLNIEDYKKVRDEKRAENVARKKLRRLAVGPHAMFLFESWETMWHQIQEMLYVEKGGEAQVADELAAYNPMIPNGCELTATLMLEVADEEERRRFLAGLGGVEDQIYIEIGDRRVKAVPEDDVERSTPGGKASAVHFLHFPFTEAEIAAFRDPETRVLLEIAHEHYGHLSVIPPETREILGKDFG